LIKPLYTVSELAELAGVTRKTMRRLLKSAGIRPLMCGRKWLIPLCEIEEKMYTLRKSFERAEIYKKSALEAAKK
jgi:excisionase family DNA binding protein